MSEIPGLLQTVTLEALGDVPADPGSRSYRQRPCTAGQRNHDFLWTAQPNR